MAAPPSPPLWLLSTAAFAVGCGMRMLDPLLPMLARDFGVGLGAVAPLVGGFALAYGLGQLAIGPLGDRLGKMRVAAISLVLYALMLLACAAVGGLGVLFALRVGSGLIAAAVIPLLMAHIGDTVPYERRQATLGRFLTGMVMAQLLAGPASGMIGDVAGWRGSFLALGLLTAAIACLFSLRLGKALLQPPEQAGRGIGLGGFIALLRRPAARRLILAAAVDGLLLFGGAFPFVASLLIEGFHLSAGMAGLIVAGFGLGSLVYTRAAPWLVRRLGEQLLVLLGGLGLTAGLAIMALVPIWWVVAVAQATLGLFFFMLHGVLQARATEALPEARSTAMAGFAMALFLGQSLGAVVFGTLIVWAGFSTAFLVAAAGVLALTFAIRAAVIPRG